MRLILLQISGWFPENLIELGEGIMRKEAQEKILVPLDGSDRALHTVKYIARNKPFHRMRIVLFHVFSSVPEGYWDLENDAGSRAITKQVRAWELSQKNLIRDYMDRAKNLLVKSGISVDSIKLTIQKRKKGIARDIIAEAQNGYIAVIVRRRGETALRNVVLGSVASKLVEKIGFVPLIIVGKKPAGNKILVGFDGSQDAVKAVDFVGAVMGGFDYEVVLLHVIREAELRFPGMSSVKPSKSFPNIAKKELTPSLNRATKKLVGSGFKPGSVITKIIIEKRSRAKAIADWARQYNFGTIAMGRKGRSRVREFFIGRVTNKVIHIARDRSVWIIR